MAITGITSQNSLSDNGRKMPENKAEPKFSSQKYYVKKRYLREQFERKRAEKERIREQSEEKRLKSNYFHQFDFDIEFANYVRETVPKTVHTVNYFQELCRKSASYLNTIHKGQGACGFDDFVTGDAYAYSEMYKSIVEGHHNGTRKLYVCDDPVSGERRPLTLEEELEKLSQGYDELITWNRANARVAQSRMYIAERQKRQPETWNQSFDAYKESQVCDYIQHTYTEFRTQYQQEYEKNGGNVDIKSVIYSIMQDGSQGIHDYCKWLFSGNGTAVSFLANRQ